MARQPMIAVASATALAACTLLPAAHAAGPQPASPVATPQVASARFIVTYSADTKADSGKLSTVRNVQAQKVRNFGRTVQATRVMGTGAEVVTLDKKLDATEAAQFIAEMKKQPGVVDVEVDRLMKPTYTPTDPMYGQQWDMKGTTKGGMNVEPLRGIVSGKGVKVAVIDTGITPHPDLNANVLPGYDMISDAAIARDGNGRDANPNDEGDWVETTDPDCAGDQFIPSSWHGTHVAGEIAAVGNNGIGVIGAANEAKIVPVRALGRCGGYTSDIVDGMLWAAGIPVSGTTPNANPVKVINMSLGGGGACGTSQQNAINQILAKGVTIVVAAGNESQDANNVNPASCSGVITVAANGPSGAMSFYSNYGSRIDVMAAGGNSSEGQTAEILSTVNTGTRGQSTAGYDWMQGTSMATPHVVGTVALMYEAKPSITPAEVKSVLKSTAKYQSCPKGCGSGIVDATAAVNKVRGGSTTPPVTPTPTPTPGDPQTGNAIVNGGFENGSTGWEGITTTIGTDSANPAHSGSGYLWLLGYGNTTVEYVGQTVTVPSNGQLSFYLAVDTDENTTSTAYDKLQVQVRSTSGSLLKTFNYSNLDNSNGVYRLKSADMSQLAGQSVQIRFYASEDSMNQTTFLVDDVTLASR